jgi:hypothetical protein
VNAVLTALSGTFVLDTIVKGVTLNLGGLMTISLLFIPKVLLIRSCPNSDAPPLKRQSLVTVSGLSATGRLSGGVQKSKQGGSTPVSQRYTGKTYMVQPSSRGRSSGTSESAAEEHTPMNTPAAAAAGAVPAAAATAAQQR